MNSNEMQDFNFVIKSDRGLFLTILPVLSVNLSIGAGAFSAAKEASWIRRIVLLSV